METYIAGEVSYLVAKTASGKTYRLNYCNISDEVDKGVSAEVELVTDGDDGTSLLGETLTVNWYQDVAGRLIIY